MRPTTFVGPRVGPRERPITFVGPRERPTTFFVGPRERPTTFFVGPRESLGADLPTFGAVTFGEVREQVRNATTLDPAIHEGEENIG